jgi:hypothetical protein
LHANDCNLRRYDFWTKTSFDPISGGIFITKAGEKESMTGMQRDGDIAPYLVTKYIELWLMGER